MLLLVDMLLLVEQTVTITGGTSGATGTPSTTTETLTLANSNTLDAYLWICKSRISSR